MAFAIGISRSSLEIVIIEVEADNAGDNDCQNEANEDYLHPYKKFFESDPNHSKVFSTRIKKSVSNQVICYIDKNSSPAGNLERVRTFKNSSEDKRRTESSKEISQKKIKNASSCACMII